MTTLTVTTRGQVTFRKEVLQHLGIHPGDKIELDLLPDGRGILKAARPVATINGFVGLLSGRAKRVATIEQINEAAADGRAGQEPGSSLMSQGAKLKPQRAASKP